MTLSNMGEDENDAKNKTYKGNENSNQLVK